jgi:hypothetical protein
MIHDGGERGSREEEWGRQMHERERAAAAGERSCSHVNCSCRDGTGDMRAAHLLTWSFDGTSSFFTSESTLCIPACSCDDISSKQPHGQPTKQQASFLSSLLMWLMHGKFARTARTRAASVPALIKLPGRLIISIFVLHVSQASLLYLSMLVLSSLFPLLCSSSYLHQKVVPR